MKTTLLTSPNKLMIVSLLSLLGIGCKKEVPMLAEETPIQISSLNLSQSRINLLQGNATNNALSVNWQVKPCNCGKLNTYTVEMALDGSNFEDKLEIPVSDTKINFTTEELNRQLTKFIPAGLSVKVAIRVRTNQTHANREAVYSDPAAVWVSTYQEFHEYTYPQYLKIPGNYETWILPTAPQIVSEKNDGEYEGYIHFTNAYPQFLMVKGTQWSTLNTYQYIGNNKFG